MEATNTSPGGPALNAILPQPQPGALTPSDDDAIDSLAAPPDVATTIAKNQVAAGQINHGDARDWAENTVASVQAALAGFGAAGKVPAGAGALYGVGAAARQGQANRQEQQKEKQQEADRQQQLAMQKQELGDKETEANRDYQLKLAENARQQANSVRDMAEHDLRMRELNDNHDLANYAKMKDEVTFRQEQVDREEALRSVGAKPMQIAGQETPAFDDLGQLEQYATDNKLGEEAHLNGYRSRPVFGADGKYHIYEVPDSGPDWHTVKDADGKTTKIFGDPLSVANYQEKVAQVSEARSRANLSSAQAQKALTDFKEEGTVKKARADLDKAKGDYSQLDPTDKEALMGDAQKRFDLSWNVLQAGRNDLRKDPDYFNVPVDAQGNPDQNSQQYKDLAEKYHIEEADAQVGEAYDTLRQLGHGYTPPGANQQKPGTVGNPTPAAVAPKKNDVKSYQGHDYKFDGTQWVRQSASPDQAAAQAAQSQIPPDARYTGPGATPEGTLGR